MLILFPIFWNSFGVQILVSNFQVTEYQQTLAELPNQSFSVTGGAPTDLALLGGLVALAIAVFCWLPRRACDVSEGSARPQSPRRREVIAQGIGWVSFIGVAAIVTPALVDRRISSKLFDDWSRERSRGGMGMEATNTQGSPRFRRKAQVAQSNHPVGWLTFIGEVRGNPNGSAISSGLNTRSFGLPIRIPVARCRKASVQLERSVGRARCTERGDQATGAVKVQGTCRHSVQVRGRVSTLCSIQRGSNIWRWKCGGRGRR